MTRLGFNPAQRVTAAVSTIDRLVAPASEHGMMTWLPTSSLADLLGEEVYRSEDRYCWVSDKPRVRPAELEEHGRRIVAMHYGF